MVALQFVGTLGTGIDAYDIALSDLEVLTGPDGPLLAAVTRSNGGLITYRIGNAGPSVADVSNIPALSQAGQQPRLVALEGSSFLVTGAKAASVTLVDLDGTGAFVSKTLQDNVNGAIQSSQAVLLAQETLVMAGPAQDGATVYALGSDNRLSAPVALTDTAQTYADAIGALAVGTGSTQDVLLVGSQSEYGVTAYVGDSRGLTAAGRIGPQDGLGIMVPTDMSVIDINGQSYAIIASSAGSHGSAGALSVLAVGPDGGLTPTDHVLDTLGSRFGTAQCVAAVEVDGRGFVLAGGGDHGLSLFTLTPGGQLIHLQSLADTAEMGLSGATDIEVVVHGDRLEVFVITQADRGIAHFLIDISKLGATLEALPQGQALTGDNLENLMVGGAGRDTLSGAGSDDILIDGAGEDRLSGNGGADLFVFVQDGSRDTITDFNPAVDKIDLSAWTFLYDTTQLQIRERGGHTRITFLDERIDVFSNTGTLVDPEVLRAAVLLDVNRAFLPPSLEVTGGAGADTLSGTWGNDTLLGLGDDDTLTGLQGDDTLLGGDGRDTAILNAHSGDAMIIDLGDGAFEIRSADGADYLRDIEVFVFRNETLTLSQIEALAVPDPGSPGIVRHGTEGADTLRGDSLNDTLFGYAGDDVLQGSLGHDHLNGGVGDDTLSGNAGNDHLTGGLGNDRMRGGTGNDTLMGGDGLNRVNGQSGEDRLYGGSQRDILNGGGGEDIAWGFEGNDRIVGGRHNDHVMGGLGPDKVYGNADDDLIEGGEDDDLLNGGGGSDTLIGGPGDDYLKGGVGGDVFVYARGGQRDRIVDFDPSQDMLLFSEDILDQYSSAQDLVDELARVNGPNVVFEFGGEDRLVLGNFTDLDALASAIVFD